MRIDIASPNDTFLIRAIRYQRAQEQARTGVHCSTIVNDIADRMIKRDKDGIDEVTGLAFQEIGNTLEDIVAEGLIRRYSTWLKPIPRVYKRVTCSPDGWSPPAQCIDEIKARWGSCQAFIELDDAPVSDFEAAIGELTGESAYFTKYKMQTLFYMQPWEAERCRIHILFLNGTFRPPFPKPVMLRMRPTRKERADNEEMILQHGHDMGLLKG